MVVARPPFDGEGRRGSVMETRRPVRLVRAAATATAQAAEPQARVAPAPRSHTRDADRLGREHLRERDVDAVGEERVALDQGPEGREVDRREVVDPEHGVGIAHVDDGRRAERGQACGQRHGDRVGVGDGMGEGISLQAKRGAPMSMVKRPPARVHRSVPPRVRKASGSAAPEANRTSATQRMPLPQVPASLPSEL